MKNKIIVSAALAALLFSAAPVSAQDSDGVQIGGQLRFRTADTAPEIGATTTDYSGRMRVNMATDVDTATKVFVEFQSGGKISSDLGPLDLHQGYLTMSGFAGGMFDVKAGRMELSYGNQRMLSALDWNDAGRAWDGLV
ncbi:MAG: alginate export family protein, partial [Planctomycetota bacterium]|nr:alginate export family protein [Planctomycetota bacterium]